MNHCAVARNASLTKARPLWRRCVLSSTRQKNSQRPSRSRWSERSRARDQGLISGGEEIIYEEMLKGWRLLVSMYGNGVLCGDICPRMMLIRYHIIERDRHQRSGRQSDDQSARQKLSLGGALGRPFPERKLCAVRPYLLKENVKRIEYFRETDTSVRAGIPMANPPARGRLRETLWGGRPQNGSR